MPTINHLLQRAVQLHMSGNPSSALSEYRRILAKAPQHIDALHLSGVAEFQLGNLDDAEFLIRAAIAINPTLPPFHNNLGNVLSAKGQVAEALASYRRSTEIDQNFADGWNNLGNTASRLNDHVLAAECFRRLVDISQGRDGQALGLLLLAQAAMCDWDAVAKTKDQITRHDTAWVRPVPAFTVLSQEFTALQQRNIADGIAHVIHAEAVKASGGFRYTHPPQGTRPERLRIGYIGDDFQDHPVGYLFVGMAEAHDKSRFETFAFSYGPPSDSSTRTRIASAMDHFIDIANQDWRSSAETIFQNKIDILIDLKGHTGTARGHIFALRPAPIQVAWLGHPGTFGGPDMDYIIADPYVIPVGSEAFYSETPIRLPHCYQPNDPKRHRAATRVAKSAVGLPEAFVFGALANSFKITEHAFRVWMDILRACPGSVLWLLDHHATATANLRTAAKQRGIDPERLIFAPRVPQNEHLERLSAMDLALDTFPYGGHTTTSDLLWNGVPVIALIGETFASRVAGSLLANIGAPELATESWDEYRNLACELFKASDTLAGLRQRVSDGRTHQPLFDTTTFAKEFEAALDQLWAARNA